MSDAPSPEMSWQAIDNDSASQFAESLRDLRAKAGDPTLQALSESTGISKSVISVAFSGRSLPTERTVLKLVGELGGNQAEWRMRRAALDPKNHGTVSADSALASKRRRFSLLQTLLIATTAAVVSAAVTGLIVFGSASTNADASATGADSETTAELEPSNGVDPMRTKCRDDAVIAASEARLNNEVHVQLMFSNECQAVWGRVTRYDNKTEGNTMTMRIWPMDEPTSKRSQSRTDINRQSLYTPMIIEPDVAAQICGQAVVTVDGKTEDLGPKLCI